MRPVLLAAAVALTACHHSSSSTTTSSGVAPKVATSVRTAAAPTAPAAPTMPAGVTPQLITLGDSLFSVRACQRCHGPKGMNGPNGPDLTAGAWLHGDGSYEQLVALVTTGVPRAQLKNPARQFAMNPRGGGPVQLTDDQVKAVAAYVWSISRKKTAS